MDLSKGRLRNFITVKKKKKFSLRNAHHTVAVLLKFHQTHIVFFWFAFLIFVANAL